MFTVNRIGNVLFRLQLLLAVIHAFYSFFIFLFSSSSSSVFFPFSFLSFFCTVVFLFFFFVFLFLSFFFSSYFLLLFFFFFSFCSQRRRRVCLCSIWLPKFIFRSVSERLITEHRIWLEMFVQRIRCSRFKRKSIRRSTVWTDCRLSIIGIHPFSLLLSFLVALVSAWKCVYLHFALCCCRLLRRLVLVLIHLSGLVHLSVWL